MAPLDFLFPFTGHSITPTLRYGDPLPEQFGGGTFDALDFGVPTGTPIRAAESGVISRLEPNNYGGGKGITVGHLGGYSSTYYHLSQFLVGHGDIVEKGQIIAYSGNTGQYTTGPHLLFGIQLNGQPIDPFPLLTGGSINSDTKVGSEDEPFFGIPGAIGDAAFTLGIIFLGAIVLLAGVLIMRK